MTPPPGVPAPGRLFVRPPARRDLAEAFRWYEGRTAGLGHEFLRAVGVTFAAVDRAPTALAVAALMPNVTTHLTSSGDRVARPPRSSTAAARALGQPPSELGR